LQLRRGASFCDRIATGLSARRSKVEKWRRERQKTRHFPRFRLAHRLLIETLIALSRLVRVVLGRPTGATQRPLLACGLAAAATSACLFTNPINTPPNVHVIALTPISRGQPAQFGAEVSDDQNESPTLEWARTDGMCPPQSEWRNSPAHWPPNRVVMETFTVDGPMTLAPFCVWTVARDRYGARTPDAFSAMPTNHAPVAVLKVASPIQASHYPFLSKFRLSAVESMDADGDPLTFNFTVEQKPPASQVPEKLLPCADDPTNTRVACFASDIPGDYKIRLTVRDLTDSGTDSVILNVLEDKLPCIGDDIVPSVDMVVHPLSGDLAVKEEDFKVQTVTDDLDPLPSPTSMLHFRWSMARNKDPLVVQETDISTFTVPTTSFNSLDTLRVRVEISDRNNGMEIEKALGACTEDKCTASSTRAFGGGDGCYLRVTWTVMYE
jgi:hypothetical protein